MDDVNIFSFFSLAVSPSLFLLFLRRGTRSPDRGRGGIKGRKGKSGGRKSLRHPLPIMDKLRSHSEKDQKWIKDIEHFSSKATRRRAV